MDHGITLRDCIWLCGEPTWVLDARGIAQPGTRARCRLWEQVEEIHSWTGSILVYLRCGKWGQRQSDKNKGNIWGFLKVMCRRGLKRIPFSSIRFDVERVHGCWLSIVSVQRLYMFSLSSTRRILIASVTNPHSWVGWSHAFRFHSFWYVSTLRLSSRCPLHERLCRVSIAEICRQDPTTTGPPFRWCSPAVVLHRTSVCTLALESLPMDWCAWLTMVQIVLHDVILYLHRLGAL